jgi:hypothetical protein
MVEKQVFNNYYNTIDIPNSSCISSCIFNESFFLDDSDKVEINSSIFQKTFSTSLAIIEQDIVIEDCIFNATVCILCQVGKNVSIRNNIFKCGFFLTDSLFNNNFTFQNNMVLGNSDLLLFNNGNAGHGIIKGDIVLKDNLLFEKKSHSISYYNYSNPVHLSP